MPNRFTDIEKSIYHESVEPYVYEENGQLVVRLRLLTGTDVTVDVLHYDKFAVEEPKQVTPAVHYSYALPAHELFQAKLSCATKRFKYVFRITLNNEVRYYSRGGLTEFEPVSDEYPFEVPYLGERDRFSPPTWAIGAKYYQVFPDRYYREPEAPADGPLVGWDAEPTPRNFFGGTLRGIRAKVDYLADLGIDVLYMTPIFKAPSNHKYDTADYMMVDPHFGDLTDVKDLVAACHDRGIRVVLDAVFNHMGALNPIFQDLLKNGTDSPYADWIYAESWPLSMESKNYETFGYVAAMPKWRTANPLVEDYLCRVGEYWIRETQIDGWRLDVSDEVEHRFWRHFRDRVKAINPESLICGEVWQMAMPWLRGDEFDSVMNYPFATALNNWIAKRSINAREFAQKIEEIRSHYPEPVLRTLWNLLDSHDTARLITLCEGDLSRAKLASFVQYTFIGAPMVYYGDEVGMQGANDPLCRAGMVWDHELQDQEMLAHYKRLIQLRKDYPVLTRGDFRPVFMGLSTDLYAFIRTLPGEGSEPIVCLINSGQAPIRIGLDDPMLPGGSYLSLYGPRESDSFHFGEKLIIPKESALLMLRIGD